MQLNDLLDGLTTQPIPNINVGSLSNNSQQLVAGCLFLAEQGLNSHGLDYLTLADCEMVSAVVYQSGYDIGRFSHYHHKFIAVDHLNEKISEIGRRFYHPRFMQALIGITGTNGKTSVSQFIAQLANYGVIGTMGYGHPSALTALTHTTPDALTLQHILAILAEDYHGVAMEVSSHALALNRVNAVDFEIAVFTNLSQDHLDFHADMEDYYAAKSTLFDFPQIHTAVIQVDDDYGYRLGKRLQQAGKRVLAFGQKTSVETFANYVRIDSIQLSQQGIAGQWCVHLDGISKMINYQTPVWGAFNVDNILAAVLALYAAGESLSQLLNAVPQLSGVMGRIEPIKIGDDKTVIIDYAHTPDALANVLCSLREHHPQRLLVVFGCGGDRDKGKRPLMAEAVNQYADIGIITDDNPRSESSEAIIADMLAGDIDRSRFQVIASRRRAIREALNQLCRGDILLIAGKGHEDYQVIGTQKVHFSDHEVLQTWLEEHRENL